jgi:uncharacterized protein YggE
MPDLATARVGVEGEGTSREEAYQGAAAAAAAVDRILASFGVAIDRVTTAALVVEAKTRWRKGETQRAGWQAFRVSVIEVTDTSRVGELLGALAGAGASIAGLSWVLAPANESFALARQRAGEDARARARQYSAALNIKLGPVAWAAEPGLRIADHPGSASVSTDFRAKSSGAAGDPVSVNPEEVTIRAALEVGYRILDDNAPSGE